MTPTSDIRPSRADLDALLASTLVSVEARRVVIDALEGAALLWGSTPPLGAAATDRNGRLLLGEVDQALEKFSEVIRMQVKSVLSSVGALTDASQ